MHICTAVLAVSVEHDSRALPTSDHTGSLSLREIELSSIEVLTGKSRS